MKRVLAYLRVSGSIQIEGDGFPRQAAACRAFAESKGWFVARNFEEQQSGSDSIYDRPVMQELLSLCGGEYDIIVIERIDRIARDLVVAELFFRECKKKGVKVYAADSGEELVNAEGDPTRKLIRQILGALAEWDKAQICAKLLAGRRRKKKETGQPCGGPLPYGQHVDSVIRKQQLEVIDYILLSRRCGAPCSEIARYLTRMGVPTYRAKSAKWSRSTVHYLAEQHKDRPGNL